MLLYLMRHGIAQDRDDPEAPADPDRQLTRQGALRTREAVRGLAALGVDPGAVLSSPYLRALASAAIAAGELGYSEDDIAQTDALLPDCDPALLFRELAGIEAGEVLCVGHAPSIDEICAYALGGGRGPLTQLKKAGVACVAIDEVAEPQGTLVWVLEPRMLRRLGTPQTGRRRRQGPR
jgi:phosphohistidine phosphatase SixA